MKTHIFNIYYCLLLLQFIKNGLSDEYEAKKRNRQISFLDSIFSDTSSNKDSFKLNNILGDNERTNSRIFTMKPEMNEVYGDMKKKYNENAFKKLNEPIFILSEAKQIASNNGSAKVSHTDNYQNQNADHVDSEAIFVQSSINERPYILQPQVETSNSTSLEEFNNSTVIEKGHNSTTYSIILRTIVTICMIICWTAVFIFIILINHHHFNMMDNLKYNKENNEILKNENHNNNNNDNNNNNFSDEDDTYNDEEEMGVIIENDEIFENYNLSENLKDIEKLLNKIMNEDFKSISFDINYTDMSKSSFINEMIVNKKDKIISGIVAYDGVLNKLDTMNFELINVVKSLNTLKKQLKAIANQKKNAIITVDLDENLSLNRIIDTQMMNSVEEQKTTTIHFEQVYELDKAKSVNEIHILKETDERTRATTKSEICALNIERNKTFNKGEFRKIKNMYENSSNLKKNLF